MKMWIMCSLKKNSEFRKKALYGMVFQVLQNLAFNTTNTKGYIESDYLFNNIRLQGMFLWDIIPHSKPGNLTLITLLASN